jgi:hypothetical protein
MQSLLLGQHYGIPLIPQQHVLYNDSALAVQIPYPADEHPIASQTSSTAQSAGWIWDIGLPTRRGIGHVYASAYISDDQAEAELRAYIVQTGGPQDSRAAQAEFQPGYRENFWHRNCVAIGLSAGFIEPLEASALAIVEMSAAMVSDDLPATAPAWTSSPGASTMLSYRWERVIDFLKLHYVLSQRATPLLARQHGSGQGAGTPAELLTLWRTSRRRARFLPHRGSVPVGQLPVHPVRHGFPQRLQPRPPPQEAAWPTATSRSGSLTRKMLGALPTTARSSTTSSVTACRKSETTTWPIRFAEQPRTPRPARDHPPRRRTATRSCRPSPSRPNSATCRPAIPSYSARPWTASASSRSPCSVSRTGKPVPQGRALGRPTCR